MSKLEIRVADEPNGGKDFIRHPDGKVLLQTKSDGMGRMHVGFVDKISLPDWPKVPSWYPAEIAVVAAIERYYQSDQVRDLLARNEALSNSILVVEKHAFEDGFSFGQNSAGGTAAEAWKIYRKK